MSAYYEDKIGDLKDIFGADDVELVNGGVRIDGRQFPIVDDVIILLDVSQAPESLRGRLGGGDGFTSPREDFSREIQYTFGEEWKEFSSILPEHKGEFEQYFDLVDLDSLKNARVMDLGCGIGRWSYFLRDTCRQLVLVDFSDAIFVARDNLRGAGNAIFFMADITRLDFRPNSADFIFSLGVLHHLPIDALAAARALKPLAPRALIYLYYALDNKPTYYRWILSLVNLVRLAVSRIRSDAFRSAFTWLTAALVYAPMIALGRAASPLGLSKYIPLYEGYRGKSLGRIRQDVYDRFFTSIERRYTRGQIMTLQDAYPRITISDGLPYWHFLLEK